MKKIKILAVVLAIGLLVAGCGNAQPTGSESSGLIEQSSVSSQSESEPEPIDEIITFSNSRLEEMLRPVIGIESGDIHTSDLEKIDSISILGNTVLLINAFDFDNDPDWEAHYSIQRDGNTLAGLTLTDGTQVKIDETPWTDFSDFEKFPNLKGLSFSGTVVDTDSISVLSNVANLTELEFPFSRIETLDWLEDFKHLEAFNLEGNPNISNYEIISSMERLKELYFSRNNLTDISFLRGLNLKTLFMNSNKISDIAVLEDMVELEELGAYTNQIQDISALQNLVNLNYLDLATNKINNISALNGLTNLEDLRIGGNLISDLAPLSNLTNLICLIAWGNQLRDISDLSGLTSLEVLSLTNNKISNLTPLANMEKVERLLIHTNLITDLTPLQNLSNLKELDVRANPISDFSPVSHVAEVQK